MITSGREDGTECCGISKQLNITARATNRGKKYHRSTLYRNLREKRCFVLAPGMPRRVPWDRGYLSELVQVQALGTRRRILLYCIVHNLQKSVFPLVLVPVLYITALWCTVL